MINLQKELDKERKKPEQELKDFTGVSDVKLLLDKTSADEQALLRSFGINHVQAHVEELRGKTIQLETVAEEYGSSYNNDQLQALCENYDLKFLPLNLYRGNVDSLLATKIIKFCREQNLDPRAVAHSNSFFILAPYESFKLKKGEVLRSDPDPIVFYKVPGQWGVYTLIHKWGNDFGIVRAFNALQYKSKNGFTMWYFIKAFLPLMVLSSLGCFIFGSMVSIWPSFILPTLAAFCYAMATRSQRKEKKGWGNYLTKHIWNEDVERSTVEP